MSRACWPVGAGLAAGLAADLVLADPVRCHPVAAFGRIAAAAERRLHRNSRAVGTAYCVVLTAAAAGLGSVLSRLTRHPLGRAAVTALATWTVVGGTSLRREATAMAGHLGQGEISLARSRISHLCGRDPQELDVAGLVRATVESVAENTSDAVVGPLFWGAAAGVPGLLGYRAVNTLDAMVGYRSPRYERFGWAAARSDDLAGLVPARLCAALTAGLAPLVGGRGAESLRVWRRDGRKHPSPNAGPVEAAFAGALGRTLGGPVAYSGRVEDRPRLGNGPAPGLADIRRSSTLSAAVGLAAGALAVAARLVFDTARR